MLEEIRRPIRIDDWNQMVIQFNKLEKRVTELEEKLKEQEPPKVTEELVYDRFFESPDEFFVWDETVMYTFPFKIEEDIICKEDYQSLSNLYAFDKEIKKDIEKMLSENKNIHLIVNIDEKEISKKKVAIKWNVDKVDDEPKSKKKQWRPKKKRWWFGL